MSLSAVGTAELSAQECGTAWLVLLTLSQPTMPQPIRVTSDAVPTVSNGLTYDPFPFAVSLPDDVEGRAPRASLLIDNTSQEIIAILRGLVTPATLTIQIVRASSPDIIERQWSGIEWQNSTYDVAAITGTLGIDDIAAEEFPYVTFDGRFRGLWP